MSTTSKVGTIADAIRSRILSGEFGQDRRLPSFRNLATEYQTTQETMNKAMQALQAEGVLVSMGSKGVFVNDSRIRMPGLVAQFFNYLEKAGLEPKGEFIERPEVITPSEEIAQIMLLPKNAQVLLRRRRQGTKTLPLRLVNGYYSMAFIDDTMLESLYTDPYYHLIQTIAKKFGKKIECLHEEIVARLPTLEEQKHLKIVRTNPVIDAKFINYTADKKTVVVFNHMILNANHFLLSYDYKINQ